MSPLEPEQTCAQLHGKLGAYIYRYYPGIGQQKCAYYAPTNPRTELQQAWRTVFANAVAAWQALPEAEKTAWRKKGKKISQMGYSLFLTDYLLAHPLE